jgi:uncharacterized protein (DUF1015 family)
MATLKPFRTLRPKPELAKDICTLPYDVMSTAEARQMAEGNPLSFLRVTRPELEMADDVDSYSSEVYARGAANLQKLISQGNLVQDDQPVYLLYRLIMGDHVQTGLVAVASCKEYDEGIVKKHELTRPDKEDDRTRHINILGAQTGAVFLTYKATPVLDKIFVEQTKRSPDVDLVAEDGIRHSAWVISETEIITSIEDGFKAVSALYVADGHHRSAAASRVAREKTGQNAHHTGDEDYNYFLTVTFPHDQMQILGYNRAVKDLNNLSVDELLKKLAMVAQISEAPANHLPSSKGECTMYLDGKWHLLTWKPEVAQQGSTVDQLDVAVLQSNVLTPLLSIGDPRTDKRISFIGGIRGTAELEKLVNSGDYAVAFAMYPTSVEELMAIADEDGLMPPKSTWFEPKLRDAMAVHLING